MYEIPEEDRKVFLEYLSRRPYIEVAALIARIAAWKKKKRDKYGKDNPQLCKNEILKMP